MDAEESAPTPAMQEARQALADASVTVPEQATREQLLALLQKAIIRVATVEPEAFDRALYERLTRAWEGLET